MHDCHEVHAVKYAQKLDRFRRDNFIVADAHDTPMPMDYCMTVCRVDEMVLGWDTLRRLADSPRHVVPGHDPQVLQHYRAGEASLAGIVARLHESPVAG